MDGGEGHSDGGGGADQHVLQLTVKKAYLDSWFNAGTNQVTFKDAEMLALEEVHDLDKTKKARRLVE
jgi:hypothetical protein